MMHILFVVDYFSPHVGGAERLFGDLAHYLSQEGIQVSVLTSKHNPQLKSIDQQQGVTIYRRGRSRMGFFRASLRFSLRQRHLMKSITHIHTSTYGAALSAWIIARFRRKSITIIIHELYGKLRHHMKGRQARAYRLYEWLIVHLTRDAIITPSHSSADNIVAIYPHTIHTQKVYTIHNQIAGSDRNLDTISAQDQELLRQHHNINHNNKLLLFVGRLGIDKGLPYVIEAYAEIAKKHPDSKLVIIAPRTAKKYKSTNQKSIQTTQEHLTANFLDTQTIWIDPVDDHELKLWISIAWRGVVPSMSEGFGYIALEMQTLGLPLIVSDIAVFREILQEKTTTLVSYGKIRAWRRVLEESLSTENKSYGDVSSPYVHASITYKEYKKLFLDIYHSKDSR